MRSLQRFLAASAVPLVLISGLASLTGCKGEPFRPDAKLDGPPEDAYDPPWWNPVPGEARNWDIQLTPPFDITEPRTMYVLSLWDVVPQATMLDYGDGAPVTVPAGALATAIAELHGRTPRTYVICHIDTGALELDDPDASKFPGFEASPPNRPTAPAADSVIGWSTTEADTNERFLDIRAASRADFAVIMFKRYDLARMIGCDGVVGDHNDAVAYETTIGHGFGMIPIEEHTSWSEDVAVEAHVRELTVGMRGGYTIAGLDVLVDDFDFVMTDRCTEFDDCGLTRPFINVQRPVFAIDYDLDDTGAPISKATICPRWADAQIQDGVIKNAALTSEVRDTCP